MSLNIQAFGLKGYSVEEESVEVLGGKGAGLVKMTQEGLPIPPGFVIPTTNYAEFCKNPDKFMTKVRKEIKPYLKALQKHFGYMPLVSVRSGARVSCPGMMDTILNVGLDTGTYEEWSKRIGEECTNDSACRLIEMYGSVVAGIPREHFEGLDLNKRSDLYEAHAEEEFPDAEEQILGSIKAVFESWQNPRAKIYRDLNGIPEEWGTAVTVQAMVFGNMDDKSCTGVLFTRNPDSGEPYILGEYLIKAQGEDVVAGIRTPDPLQQMEAWNPQAYHQLMHTVAQLEEQRKDVQDVEFTVQSGQLYILQTRNAKRSARAAVRLALDLCQDYSLTYKAALKRVTAKQFDTAQMAILDPNYLNVADYVGIPACSGVVSGVIVTSSKAAINCKTPCILVTAETTPDDIGGMNAAKGVLTMTGGATSHAAVVARGMNKPCVVGLGADISFFVEGNTVSIDGATGRVWMHEVPVIDGSADPYIQQFKAMMWAAINCNEITREHKLVTNGVLLRMPELLFMPVLEAVDYVKKALNESFDLTLDLSRALGHEEQQFFAPFRSEDHDKSKDIALIEMLESSLTEDQKKKLRVLTPWKTKLKTVASAKDLEQLVMAEQDVVWTGKPTEAVTKVLEWKLSQGIKIVSFGVVTEHGYITERQLIAELLA
jgi:phosphoenolpyruvate synthase/pyruvate phosphate dikinase